MDNEIRQNIVSVYHAVHMLNMALECDRLAITMMFNSITPCNASVAHSDYVEAMPVGDGYGITVLGIINSIFSYSDDSQYRIFPIYSDDMLISEFRLGKIQ